ncbi:MAG: 2-hydroxycyclohexanecarboxyl-CoA dehydrogenase [Ilumatobacter sp.]|jgi:2-hydroxycyclohexanecarboxyl-CoA dehydrogenase
MSSTLPCINILWTCITISWYTYELTNEGGTMGRFDDTTVVVTGGGGGIGGALCRGFAAEGARVAVLDRDEKAAQNVADEISSGEATALAVACDITERDSVDAAVARVTDELGPIDVLVNNAGWDLFVPFLETQPEDWGRLIDINLVGPLHMHHAILPGMVERSGGRVVNISSDAARVGSSGEAVYAACKAGLVAFSKTLAREHSRHGITFNVVCPGPTDTALLATVTNASANPEKLREAFRRSIPVGRLGQPDDLVGAVLFFASNDAAFVTGQVLSVSGGLTMAG